MERREFLTSSLAILGVSALMERIVVEEPFKLDTDLLIAQLKAKYAGNLGHTFRPDLNPHWPAKRAEDYNRIIAYWKL